MKFPMRFDANLDHHHHHHVCVRCGLARDFESEELNVLRIPASVKELGSIVGTHVEVRGVCGRCAKEQPDGAENKNPKEPRGKERSKT